MKAQKPRIRGLGTVYQRGPIWWAMYYVRGKRHRESSESHNRNDALALLKKRISEVQAGKPHGAQVEKTTLGDLKTMLIDFYKANKMHSTERAAEGDFKHLLAYFKPDARAIDITNDRVTAYVAHRQKEKSPYTKRVPRDATINNELAMLRRAFNLALDASKVARTPRIKVLRLDNARKGFFEREQFEAVLKQLPERLHALARVAYLTGWRPPSELQTREWKHVRFEGNGWLRLEPGETKNKEGRIFPINILPKLREALTAQRERVAAIEKATEQIVNWVFVYDDGSQIKDFRRAWASACKQAGIKRLVIDFRRTAVRNLERAGVSRSAAMKLTGHKTEMVYRRYAIVSEGDLVAAVTKLAALHASDSKQSTTPKVIALHAKS